jgi:DNA-binding NarL/FixJ family response regulator
MQLAANCIESIERVASVGTRPAHDLGPTARTDDAVGLRGRPLSAMTRLGEAVDNGFGTVLVADADERARSLVTDLLRRAGYTAVAARDGQEALDACRRERPALAVLDIGLSGLSGYEVCRRLKDEFGDALPVILVSASRTEPYDRAAGLLIGADDYVTKPFDRGELLARVRRCIVRAALIKQSATGQPDNPFGLSPRELEVLNLLAHGLTTARIAERLVISRKTVATHVQRILAKLGAHSRGEAVAIAYRAHMVQEVEADIMVEGL